MRGGEWDYVGIGERGSVLFFFLGIMGTWEGWVPSPTDLYLRGNNIAAWTSPNSSATFESGGIMVTKRSALSVNTTKSYNLTPYNKINVLFKVISWGTISTWQKISLSVYKNGGTTSKDEIGYTEKSKLPSTTNVEYTISLDIGNVNYNTQGLRIVLQGLYTDYNDTSGIASWTGYIFRIWLS